MDENNVESQQPGLDAQFSSPLEYDTRYNVAICSECSTGLAFDWIQSHLWNKHGIKKQLEDVMEYLNIEAPTLSSIEIERWISEVWVVSQPFQGVPIKMGMACNECHYSCITKKAMKDHFRTKHPGMKWVDFVTECKVQMLFQGRLKKYIQIEDAQGSDAEMQAGNDWQQALEQDFKAFQSRWEWHAMNAIIHASQRSL